VLLGYSHGLGNLHISGKDRGAVGRMGSLDLLCGLSWRKKTLKNLGFYMASNEKIWGMTTNIVGHVRVGHVRVAIEVLQESDRSRQTIADFIIP